MGKKATTLDQQIEILKNRGMEIDLPDEKVKEILLDIGYYRLGFYWHPFETDESHNFESGTKFSTIVNLYYFNSDLRHILLKYIYRVEVSFRTKLIYFTCNLYPDSPAWFIDSKTVHVNFIQTFDTKVYNEAFKKNPVIKKHHIKYVNDKYAPAWKTIEFMTFGQSIRLYSQLKDEILKEKIAKSLGFKKVKIFSNHIQTIKYLRDVCSHGGVLHDLKQPKAIITVPGADSKSFNKQNLTSTIKVLLFTLQGISENRRNELIDDLKKFVTNTSNNSDIKEIIDIQINT